jgi:chromosomal replication initiation ATPase DnaA
VADGIPAGRREKFSGGGLMRSRQTDSASFESFDERILGSGEFVGILRKEEALRARLKAPIDLTELVNRVSEKLQIDPEKVRRPSKTRHLAEARGVICYLAVRHLGYRGADVGKELHLGPTGVSIAVRRGEKSITNFQGIVSLIVPDR